MMRILMTVLLAGFLAGCASSVVTDYQSRTAFSDYTTWAFAPDQKSGGFLSLDGQRVREAVARELEGTTLKRADEAEADLLISWRIQEEDRLEQSGVGLGFGFGHGNFGWGITAPPPIREVTEGKLIVRLADRESGEVVWQAISRRYLRETQFPETRQRIIDEVVSDMFSQYPPELN